MPREITDPDAQDKDRPGVLTVADRLHMAVQTARANLLARTPMLTQNDAVKALGVTKGNAAEHMEWLEGAGKIFAIMTPDGIRYPEMQFMIGSHRLQPVIERLIVVRAGRETNEKLLAFLMYANSALTDRGQDLGEDAMAAYPASLIGKDDEGLVELYRESFTSDGEDWNAPASREG